MLIISILMFLISPFTAFIPVIGMIYQLYKQKSVIEINPLNSGLALLFIWALLSGWSNSDMLSVIGAFGILIFLVYALYLQNVSKSPKTVENILLWVWKCGLITVGFGILEKGLSYFIDMTWFSRLFWTINYVPTETAYRIIGTFGNPNVAGDMYAGLFLLSLYFLFKQKGLEKVPFVFGGLLCVLAMSFTGSKGAALGLELAVLAYALFTRSQRNRFILMGIFMGVLALVFCIPELNHSMNSRAVIWQKCYRLFTHQPIAGYGVFGIFKYTGEVHGHNILVTLLTTLGTVGLLIFTGIQIYLIHCMRTLKHEGLELLAVLVALQVLVLGHGVIDFTMMLPQVSILYFGSMAMTSSLASRYMAFPAWNWSAGTVDLATKASRLKKGQTGIRT